MPDLYYVTTSGKVIPLEGDFVATDAALPMRGSSVKFELGYRNVKSRSRPAKAVEMDSFFVDKDEADTLIADAIDGDYHAETPGTFYAVGWSQRGYIIDQEPKEVSANSVKLTLVCVLLDGVWRKPKTIHLFPNSGDSEGTKKYPYTYPYKYASEYGNRIITVDTKSPVDFEMCIFGYARNPSVRIADNVYTVNVTVPANGYLLLNSIDASATLVEADGTRTDVYSDCVRGKGEGYGTYAWEKIPAGTSYARWDDSFGFDVTVYEESSTPPYGGGS